MSIRLCGSMPEFKNIVFEEISSAEIERLFNDFFDKNSTFYEIIKSNTPIGFYRIKKITDKYCEISLFINEGDRDKISKNLAIACFNYPFQLGFKKVLISTNLLKMYRFLSNMTKLGVNYLFKSSDFYWFEVKI
jgi:hypothetical protein